MPTALRVDLTALFCRFRFRPAAHERGPVEKVCQYPVYEGTETENAAVTYITFICENATEEEQNVLDLLTMLLSDSSSALMSIQELSLMG